MTAVPTATDALGGPQTLFWTASIATSFSVGETFPGPRSCIPILYSSDAAGPSFILTTGHAQQTEISTAITAVSSGEVLSFTYVCNYTTPQGVTSTSTKSSSSSPPTSLGPASSSTSSSRSQYQGVGSRSTSINVPTQTPAPRQPSGRGISRAATAGVGIGAGLLGILIGFLVSWLFSRYQNRRSSSLVAAVNEGKLDPPSNPKHSPGKTIIGLANPLNHYLLDGAGDSEIITELSALGFLLEQHVRSHYHQQPLHSIPESLSDSLAQLGLAEDKHGQFLELAQDTKTRPAAIRFLLAWAIFSNLDMHTAGSLSLLPPVVTALSRSLPAPKDAETRRTAAVTRTLILWRRLTAFVIHEKPDERSALVPPPNINAQIGVLVDALNIFLSPFELDGPRSIDSQTRHLEGVVAECTKFGYALFSHPCEWQFTFQRGSAQREGIVVMPGLDKLCNREGELYDAPKSVVRPALFHSTGGFP